MEEQLEEPFDLLYVSVVDGDKRVYTKIAPARSRVTATVDKRLDRFTSDCEIWTVGANGWVLDFAVKAGDHHSKTNWKNSVAASKRADQRRELYYAKLEEDKARELYESLKERFDS